MRRTIRLSLPAIVGLLLPSLAAAADPSIAELKSELALVKKEYAALQREAAARLAALEAKIEALEDSSSTRAAKPAANRATASKRQSPALDVSGDFRLRYENTSSDAGVPARNRGVLRGRLGASYRLDDRFTLGARLTTGDPDDPNSSDVTMGNFTDDLSVSLDQAYARFEHGGFELVGGKFAKPFASTDLVWDGDVNPYGVAGSTALYAGRAVTVDATVLYSIVDEQIGAGDSDMAGGQLSLNLQPAPDWRFGVDAGYFDYTVGSLLAADAGDTRGNNVIAASGGTAYLSDFDLLDVIVRMDYLGLESGRPLSITGDYVRNLGARVPEDSGYAFDVSLGELGEAGDWRVGYGYAVAETDAVLAAFSHDNTTYSTNYRQHTLAVDYMPFDHTYLNLTGYLYRRKDFALVDQPGGNDDVSRIRLNLQYRF